MMKKHIDCVKIKNDIQAKLLRQYAGLTDDERVRQIERRLALSKSPVGRLWRDLMDREKAQRHVAENRAAYGERK